MIIVQEDKLYNLLIKIAHYVVEETSKDENETSPPKQETLYADKKTETSIDHINGLPDILTAQHIADYLHISRKRVYELFQLNPKVGGIPNFSIGTSKRVKKLDFINWLEVRKAIRGWGNKNDSL
ncbi:hypothetical protein PIPA1_28840 [Pelosinus sp. IPA-1]|nr:hypothetical protein PIPA1_28840 [Pelosinus sp. IPA-1]